MDHYRAWGFIAAGVPGSFRITSGPLVPRGGAVCHRTKEGVLLGTIAGLASALFQEASAWQ